MKTIIKLLAILQKSLDRALCLYIFIRKVRSSGVRASITIDSVKFGVKEIQSDQLYSSYLTL